jgi:hypothetical protein
MDDNLFDNPPTVTTSTADPKPNGTADPTPPAAVPVDDRTAALERQLEALGGQVQQLVGGLTQLMNTPVPEAPKPPAPVPSASEALNDLAADPYKFVKSATQKEIDEALASRVNPNILQSMETMGQMLVAQRAYQIDAEFGAGTYDAVFKPAMDADLAQLRQANPRALADANVVNSLINRHYAPNFATLSERKANLAKSAEEERRKGIETIVSHIPTGGAPRLRNLNVDDPDSLPDGVKADIAEMERTSGQSVDRKLFTKLYHAGKDSGPGRHSTSLKDFLDAVGANPDRKKSYGLS